MFNPTVCDTLLRRGEKKEHKGLQKIFLDRFRYTKQTCKKTKPHCVTSFFWAATQFIYIF